MHLAQLAESIASPSSSAATANSAISAISAISAGSHTSSDGFYCCFIQVRVAVAITKNISKRGRKMFRFKISFSASKVRNGPADPLLLNSFCHYINLDLHKSFKNPKRVLKSPNFTFSEEAWGSSDILTTVHFLDDFHIPFEFKIYVSLDLSEDFQEFAMILRNMPKSVIQKYLSPTGLGSKSDDLLQSPQKPRTLISPAIASNSVEEKASAPSNQDGNLTRSKYPCKIGRSGRLTGKRTFSGMADGNQAAPQKTPAPSLSQKQPRNESSSPCQKSPLRRTEEEFCEQNYFLNQKAAFLVPKRQFDNIDETFDQKSSKYKKSPASSGYEVKRKTNISLQRVAEKLQNISAANVVEVLRFLHFTEPGSEEYFLVNKSSTRVVIDVGSMNTSFLSRLKEFLSLLD